MNEKRKYAAIHHQKWQIAGNLLQSSWRKKVGCLFLSTDVIVCDQVLHFILYFLTSFFLWAGDPQQLRTAPAPHRPTLPEPQHCGWCTADSTKDCRHKTTAENNTVKFRCGTLVLSVGYGAISLFRRLYCTALVAVHKLAGECSAHFGILCREGVRGCLYCHCSNITVINATFHLSQRRKVLRLSLVLLLMHQPVWPNCGSHLKPESCSLRQLLTIPFPCHEIAIALEHLMFNTSINLPACVLFSWRLCHQCNSTASNCDVQPAFSHQPSLCLAQCIYSTWCSGCSLSSYSQNHNKQSQWVIKGGSIHSHPSTGFGI